MHSRGSWSTCALPAEGMNQHAFRTLIRDIDCLLHGWIIREREKGESGNIKNTPVFPLTLIPSRFNIFS
jgi:hypothetical protein